MNNQSQGQGETKGRAKSGTKDKAKGRSKLKILNYILKAIIFLSGLVLMVMFFSKASGTYKIWSYLATMALPFSVDLVRLLGLKISDRLEAAILIFIIPAMILGIDLDWYKIIYPFDKIVHGASGILAAFGAREIINQASGKPDNIWFKVTFSICFVSFTAVTWECIEFLIDRFAGTNMQELITPGIEDTMFDLIVAMLGGIIGTVLAFGHLGSTKNKTKK